MPSTNLYCSLQNRLGALDRVLLAFTHRGIVPTQLFSSNNEETASLELAITFDSTMDEHDLQKLIKSLQKQVYVLDVRRATFDDAALHDVTQTPIANFTPAAKIAEAVPA